MDHQHSDPIRISLLSLDIPLQFEKACLLRFRRGVHLDLDRPELQRSRKLPFNLDAPALLEVLQLIGIGVFNGIVKVSYLIDQDRVGTDGKGPIFHLDRIDEPLDLEKLISLFLDQFNRFQVLPIPPAIDLYSSAYREIAGSRFL